MNDLEHLQRADHADPFAFLGPHGGEVRVWLPGALAVELLSAQDEVLAAMNVVDASGLFVAQLPSGTRYRLRIHWPQAEQVSEDPYAFGLLLSDLDLYLFSEGNHRRLGKCLGAQAMEIDGVPGVRFAVWAPNARRVSVVGNFNGWDGRRHPMRLRYPSGVWELFIPRLQPGEVYKYELLGAAGTLPLKADPLALATEAPPATGSRVADPAPFDWQDHDWMSRRAERQAPAQPLSIYELHAGSWQWVEDRPPSWDELAERLIPYIREQGFSHIELMPVMEHPFGGSWGYQTLSMFAPTARYGSPADFARFVDRCHQAQIGVILDWVPAHFPTDEHGLAHFDGTSLYEYAHPFEGFHQDWDTYIYNLGRSEVHGFMLASALHWLREYHVDGLRVDAVASMLYRDYSRKEGEWIPNRHGGRENLEAIEFLSHLNTVVASEAPGALVIAEESTAWPGVSRPAEEGGLGFSYKWNMGWMHDSLSYIREDPVYRSYHHHKMTFGLLYAFSERFILPISHDEVVHGKGSLLGKMPGDRWQQFANLRLYLSLMWTHPGKKLLFMGCEFGQWREWDHDSQLDWYLLRYPEHLGVQMLVRELNRLLHELPALHAMDDRAEGFHWLIGDDQRNSVFAWLRLADREPLLVVHNFTPVPRPGYSVGVPLKGHWRVLLNSDAQHFAGSAAGSQGIIETQPLAAHGQPQSLPLDLPPLGCLILIPEGDARVS
ncbi:1,4-alpha-glucan branching protein GlgB [Pseudomonas sp. ZM23]|uniref:1,4-alpha-glucan branching enzyme GlgB n=1 Tax=Pseudomonas triclosanedens TaxID=2961893 RepID=A0ABY7A5E3_9PSED|nr:1,4-alpha-glucan branching protein GlgB [Pseudomonas triclosanedens]MCP8466254.1 1,4-alpha-glucan branching protein GlgB [Pseudomonas triclosanedens]MCP8471780.1 1,4-alpha-glucan branching protein GlgB [Pseudomonas triclosanedens]MCP8478475.1 1,4-alpha-glucan branching protein GlgB [Pseudomonas triclosanedens]WAI52328.1 1,4-alpha-glucan branching protein GlgB [Pseudomonas triclosanedens]